ncbi:MAG TPA: ferritin-like domain-containing protein [Kofleriaceae bacterium]|nr:ferritin-like domain-containing protein [Kofleriaceae bacterium]
MDLDLDRMLESVKAGQWSIDQLDWSVPLAGADRLDARTKREAGLALVFTARLERQAARIFALASEHADDPRAAAIYQFFAIDERRHADAEVLLAQRYGVTETDLPKPLHWAMKVLESNFDEPNTALHEMSSASIILFELALDSLLVPSLKDLTDDALQARVFRLIDLDESRHLAMDYWLLDRKGEIYQGRDARAILTGGASPGFVERMRGKWKLYRTLLALFTAFGTTTVTMPVMRKAAEGGRMDRYLARVAAIPKKAPHALELATFRMALGGQRRVLSLMGKLS